MDGDEIKYRRELELLLTDATTTSQSIPTKARNYLLTREGKSGENIMVFIIGSVVE